MISCERAEQTVTTIYSVIKFLKFDGFAWRGESLPLMVSSLGELVQTQLDLKDQSGKKLDCGWEMGFLRARFLPGQIYELGMRLEYQPPFQLSPIKADFISIHPRSYALMIDFQPARTGYQRSSWVTLGNSRVDFSPHEETQRTLDSGQQLRIQQSEDTVSLAIQAQTSEPFGHANFPEIFLL